MHVRRFRTYRGTSVAGSLGKIAYFEGEGGVAK